MPPERPVFSIAFHEIPLGAFRDMPPELRTEAFFRVNELTNAYVDARARDVVRWMATRPGDLAPARRPAREWLERKLARAPGCSAGTGGSPDGEDAAARLRDMALSESPALAPALDLIDVAASGYPDYLLGKRGGSEILFDPALPGLWERYFSNENPLYAAGNVLAAHAAARAIERRAAIDPLRVLEVGAGCGSAAEALLDRAGAQIGSCLLTDISPHFLRRARERLLERAGAARPGLDFRLLDLDRPAAWKLPAGSFDLVYAVNVLHAVKDLSRTLRGLRDLLAADGAIVLGECVRPGRGVPVHPEFVFQLLDGFHEAALDPDLRPEPGFLDAASWRASLGEAGLGRIEMVPDFEAAVSAYPGHSLAAIVASPGPAP